MEPVDTNDVLNRLSVIHNRSLPMYLSYASPSWRWGDDTARQTLQHIVADQKEYVDRIGSMIMDNDGVVRSGEFPMTFTGLHDLSFDFLLGKLIEHQKRDIAAIEACVLDLNRNPMAKALAEESLGAAKAHLQSLEELAAGRTAGAGA